MEESSGYQRRARSRAPCDNEISVTGWFEGSPQAPWVEIGSREDPTPPDGIDYALGQPHRTLSYYVENGYESSRLRDFDRAGPSPAGQAVAMTLRSAAYRAMSALSRPYMRVSGRDRRLRILAYHEVHSPELFRRQMSWLTSQFDPVPLRRCLDHGSWARLPERPVVVTFDDGDPSIVQTALPHLEEYGVEATAFICPGVVDTTDAYWWQVVDAAIDSGVDLESLIEGPAIARLKSVPDLDRLRLVDQIAEKMEAATGQKAHKRQITSEQLRVWMDAGHQLGNHTWDHPILDMCTDDEQRRQIMLAHEWLVDFAGECDVFAYPNGTTADHLPVVLTELGYRMALLFDHRISSESDPRFQVSRIRVNGHDSLDVFRAKVSGIHPLVYRFTGREGLRTDRTGRM